MNSEREEVSASQLEAAALPVSGASEPRQALKLVCPACRGALAWGDATLRCGHCQVDYHHQDGMWQMRLGRMGAPGYDPHHFDTLAEVEGRHFWFVARRELILEAMRRSVPDLGTRPMFDVGCGSGGLAAFLAAGGVRLSGACDAYPEALWIASRRLEVPVLLVDEGRLPPLGSGQPMIGLFDVLEHIDDDAGTLAWVAEALEPGGYLVLTVPAHPCLYNDLDRSARHRRRYRRRELAVKLAAAGLRVRLLTHFMAPLALPILLVSWSEAARRRLGRPPLASPVGARLRVRPFPDFALGLVLSLERRLLRLGSLPFGSSLMAVAERPVDRALDPGPMPSARRRDRS